MRLRPHCAAFLAVALVTGALAHEHDDACQNTPAVNTARQALEGNAKDLNVRFALADALIAGSCFGSAVHVLEAGEELHGRNAKLQGRLREARSMLGEQQYFEELNRAEESARLSRNVLRCSKLAEVRACDEALQLKPDDPDIMVSKADALLQSKKPIDALALYRRVRTIAPGHPSLEPKIAAAIAQQEALVSLCKSATDADALQACDVAIVHGDENEFALLKRKAMLLQVANQSAAALDAYIAANRLQQGDRSIALAIVALSDSTARKDAVALTARGSALLTLNRAVDAVGALRQALALTPGAPEVMGQLARAQQLAQQQAARQPAAVLAEAEPPRRYSNSAPATRSH